MKKLLSLIALLVLITTACQTDPPSPDGSEQSSRPTLSEILPSANIYEVNVRQYTPEGTFKAFSDHLPRLKEMGVDILWFMPIFPISIEKRKGTMGSYYSVSDYKKVNPEFGTLEEFKSLVSKMHNMGFLVVLDWVPNHTGWDHPWIQSNPDWYTKDMESDTIIHPAGTDWYDVADLNYGNDSMREEMISDLLFWIREVDIDGYRMDVASEVPIDFWKEASERLHLEKDIFMLAEAAHPPHRNEGYFDASYGWDLMHIMNKVAKGDEPVSSIWGAFEADRVKYNKGWHMCFTTNHDENSWNGTVFDRYGDKHLSYAVLAFTLQGMPLIYSGQEAGLDRALAFFEKDSIDWTTIPFEEFYTRLLKLKHEHQALHNGEYGGEARRISSSENVIAFIREKADDTVIVAINLGDGPGSWFPGDMITGMQELFSGNAPDGSEEIILESGEFQIWTR